MAKRFPTEVALYEELKQACPSLFPETECEVEYIEVPVDAQGNVEGCKIYGYVHTFAPECNQLTWEVLTQFKFAPCILVQIKLSNAKIILETIADDRIEGQVSNSGINFIEVTTKDQRAIAAACPDWSRFSLGDFCVLYRSTYMIIENSCIPQILSPGSIARLNSLQVSKSRVKPLPEFQTIVPKRQTVAKRQIGPMNESVDWTTIDVEVYPKTIDERRLPILTLKNLSEYKEPQSARVFTIANRYSHWRKSRGDGNSYYRTVAVAYLEHLCRRTTPPSDFRAFYSSIFEQTKLEISAANGPYIKYFLKKLKELYQSKQNYPVTNQALTALQTLLQDSLFDQGAVMTIRAMASYSFQQLFTHPDLAPFLIESSPEVVTRQIETLGEEAEGVVLQVLACALNVKLVHITLSPQSSREYSYTPFVKGQKIPVLHFLIQVGQCSVLYPTTMQLIDQYSYTTNSFMDTLVQMPYDENDVLVQV